MDANLVAIVAVSLGFIFDQLIGDPHRLPHPIVGFGKLISWGEMWLNKGKFRFVKGALLSLILVLLVFWAAFSISNMLGHYNQLLELLFIAAIVFYSLSARTLRTEVKMVFEQVELSVENGRKQVARIVGRDTTQLNKHQIQLAALETLAENLSDGVIAPLFWFAILGAPGMLAYKMINTLDSMIGYKSERYLYFGRFAARMDDVVNFIPARLTSLIILLVSNSLSKFSFVIRNAKNHTSPNSGYPEAALAGILNCRFGGPNSYFGKTVDKPFIGTTDREFGKADLNKAITTNHLSEFCMLTFVIIYLYIFY